MRFRTASTHCGHSFPSIAMPAHGPIAAVRKRTGLRSFIREMRFRRAYTVEGWSSVRCLSRSLLETPRCAHLKIARQPDSHLFLQDDPKVRVSVAVCNEG